MPAIATSGKKVKKWTLGIQRILCNRGKSEGYRAASVTFPKLSIEGKLRAPIILKDTRRHMRDTWETPGDTDATMTYDDPWSRPYFFCWCTYIFVLYNSKIYFSIYSIFHTCLHIYQLYSSSCNTYGIATSTYIPALTIFLDYMILVLYLYILKVTIYTLVYILYSPLDSIYS